MSKATYQFRLRKDPGTYYYVDGAGAVSTSATAIEVKQSIVDWDKLQLQWKRHTTYHGVFRNFSPESVRVAKDGARILRHVFNTLGSIEALCELEVYKLNTTDQLYYQRGICAIDFSKYNNEKLYVNVALMQGGLSARLQAYDSIDFTILIGIPGTDPDSDLIWISGNPPGSDPGGVMLLGQYNYQSQGDGNADIVLTDTPARSFEEATLGLVYVNQEGAYAVLTPGSPLQGVRVDLGAGGGLIENANIAKVVNGFTGTFSGAINFQSIINAPISSQNITAFKVMARVFNGSWSPVAGLGGLVLGSETVIWTDPFGAIGPGGSSTTLSTGIINYTWNFMPGDFLVISLRMETPTSESGGSTTQLQVTLDSQPTDLQLTFQYRQPDTPCRVLSHWQVFRKLFHALTESTAVDPISDLLTTDVYPGPDVFNLNPANTFFTSGDGLRQLYQSADGSIVDPAIKTNFRDFANDAFLSNCAGIGIELDGGGNEVLRLEKLAHFYQKSVLIKDLGAKITNWKMYPYNEYLGNQIKAGYNTKTYDEVNGRFEFNAEGDYQTPVTRVHKDIEYKAPYNTGCYDAEYVRANLANKKTTDSANDNETYKFQSSGNRLAIPGIAPNPLEVDKAQTVTAGLPADVWPTVYNVPFTPARQMGRMLPWLKSLYYGLVNPILKFITGTKNKDLVSSMYTGPVVTEAADIDLTPDGTGDDLLFIPTVFEFDVQIPIDLPDLMAVNPYGVFGHTVQRDNLSAYLEGFTLEIGINDGTNNVYNVKLLCSPNTPVPEWL